MINLVEKLNPKVLIWARETAHMSIFDVPESIISRIKLKKIEDGEEIPTLIQLQKLAKKYDRNLMTLLADEIPIDDYVKLPFFRKYKKNDYDSALVLFIRDLQKKQDWARNYLSTEGYDKLDFVGSFKIGANVNKSAQKIKNRLKLPNYSDFSNSKMYFKAIKETLENNHIFISVTGSNKSNKSISLEKAQGFSLPDDIAPFIFVNTKNTPNAKVFTLIHEVVHIFINESGISEDAIKFRKSQCKEDQIENFCNLVTSEILMPEELFRKKIEIYQSKENLKKLISQLSKHFLVSELAICVRLWKLSLIDYRTYNSLYSQISDAIYKYLKEQSVKMKKSEGGNYYANMLLKNGALLSQLAFFAYKENKILGKDLYRVLNVKLDNLNNYFSAV